MAKNERPAFAPEVIKGIVIFIEIEKGINSLKIFSTKY
jgi:hypothetical protein